MKRTKAHAGARAQHLRKRDELARECCETYANALGAIARHEQALERLKRYVRRRRGNANT